MSAGDVGAVRETVALAVEEPCQLLLQLSKDASLVKAGGGARAVHIAENNLK